MQPAVGDPALRSHVKVGELRHARLYLSPRPPAISEHTSISEGSHRTVVGSSRTAEASERSVERWHVRVERRSDSPPSAVGEHTTIIEGEERAAEASDRSVERRRVQVEQRRPQRWDWRRPQA